MIKDYTAENKIEFLVSHLVNSSRFVYINIDIDYLSKSIYLYKD